MSQKVIKVGSSIALTIPKYTAEKLHIGVGDSFDIGVDEDLKKISFSPAKKVSKELKDWTNSFISTYRSALDELSKK